MLYCNCNIVKSVLAAEWIAMRLELTFTNFYMLYYHKQNASCHSCVPRQLSFQKDNIDRIKCAIEWEDVMVLRIFHRTNKVIKHEKLFWLIKKEKMLTINFLLHLSPSQSSEQLVFKRKKEIKLSCNFLKIKRKLYTIQPLEATSF